MSLKNFHIFFIAISVLLSGYLAYWGFQQSSTPMALFAAASVVVSAFLTIYLFVFISKTKQIPPHA